MDTADRCNTFPDESERKTRPLNEARTCFERNKWTDEVSLFEVTSFGTNTKSKRCTKIRSVSSDWFNYHLHTSPVSDMGH